MRHRPPVRYRWAMLLAHVYVGFSSTCRCFVAGTRILFNFLSEASSVQRIPSQIGGLSPPPVSGGVLGDSRRRPMPTVSNPVSGGWSWPPCPSG